MFEKTTMTTIEEATKALGGDYLVPWGSRIAGFASDLVDGKFLGDPECLDGLETAPKLSVSIQPGNGGPVEDWQNLGEEAKGGGGGGGRWWKVCFSRF